VCEVDTVVMRGDWIAYRECDIDTITTSSRWAPCLLGIFSEKAEWVAGGGEVELLDIPVFVEVM